MQGVLPSGEHLHDDYWQPESPDKVVQIYKPIKRQLKKTEIAIVPLA